MAFEMTFDRKIGTIKVSFDGFITREQVQNLSGELTRFAEERNVRSPFNLILDFLRTKYMSSSAMDEFRLFHADMMKKNLYRALALVYFTSTGEEQIGKTLMGFKDRGIIAHFPNDQDASLWIASLKKGEAV